MRAIKRALSSPPDPREPSSCPAVNTLGITSFPHPIDCQPSKPRRDSAPTQCSVSARSPIQRTVAQLSASKRPRTPDSLQSLPTLRLSLRGVISRCAPKYTSTHSRGVAFLSHLRRCASVKTKLPCRHGYQVLAAGSLLCPALPRFQSNFPRADSQRLPWLHRMQTQA